MSRRLRTLGFAAAALVLGGALLWFSTREDPESTRGPAHAPSQAFQFSCPLEDGTLVKIEHSEESYQVQYQKRLLGFETIAPLQWPSKKGLWEKRLNALRESQPQRLEGTITEAEREQMGLAPARLALTCQTEAGAQTLLIGAANSMTGKTPVQEESGNVVWLIASDLLVGLSDPHSAQLSQRLVPFPRASINRVSLRREDKEIFLLKNEQAPEGKWTVEGFQQPPATAHPGKSAVFFTRLTRGLKIKRFLPKNWESPILSPAKTVLTVATAADEWVAMLAPADTKGLLTVATVGDQKLLLDTKLFEEFPKHPSELEDLTLSSFNPVSVGTIRVHLAGRLALVLQKKPQPGAAEWECLPPGPKGCRARGKVINGVIKLFSRLTADSRYQSNPTPKDLARAQLSPPSVRYEFLDSKSRTLGDVRIGKYSGDSQILVQGTRSTPIDLVEDRKLLQMPTALEKLIQLDAPGK